MGIVSKVENFSFGITMFVNILKQYLLGSKLMLDNFIQDLSKSKAEIFEDLLTIPTLPD